MAYKGKLSGYFRDGDNDTPFCTDWKFLTKEERTEIINFIKEIAEKDFIIGKTKSLGFMITMKTSLALMAIRKRIIGTTIVGQPGVVVG
ncbi:hypothetical protein MBS26_001688 [Klebsiella pneumoniae]